MLASKKERAMYEENLEGDYDDQIDAQYSLGYDDAIRELLAYLETN